MKLTEISMSKEHVKAIRFMDRCSVARDAYTITEDGRINVHDETADVLINHELIENGKLPVVFGVVAGLFDIGNALLTTFDGCPHQCGNFYGYGNLIHDLRGCPEIIDEDCDLENNKNLTSLEGIADHIISIGGVLKLSPGFITRGGLGLIQIEKLQGIRTKKEAYVDTQRKTINAFNIITKYLEKPNEIFECQSELIDAGLEAYAEL